MYKSFFEFLDDILMSNRDHYFTNREILEHYYGRELSKSARNFERVRDDTLYDSLYGAYDSIRDILKSEYSTDYDFKNGVDARGGYRYPLNLENPMKQFRKDHKQMRTKQLLKLLEQSIGLFPRSWLADFVAGAQRLANDDGKIIWFDHDTQKAHLRWIPTIFDAIEKQKVISFKYNPRYEDKFVDVLLHPYFLKEYDGNWFVFGYINPTKEEVDCYSNYAIDRIVSDIKVEEQVEYIRPEKTSFVSSYFEDIVGVTLIANEKKKLIKIETLNKYTHGRIRVNKLHKSQKEIQDYTDAQHGLFTIHVRPNNELFTLLLSYGYNIKVGDSEGYEVTFYNKLKEVMALYKPTEESSKENDKEFEQKK